MIPLLHQLRACSITTFKESEDFQDLLENQLEETVLSQFFRPIPGVLLASIQRLMEVAPFWINTTG